MDFGFGGVGTLFKVKDIIDRHNHPVAIFGAGDTTPYFNKLLSG